MADKTDIFDREVRAKMLSGTEPVGDALWAGVQNRIAAAKHRAVVVLWWRRAAFAFSAAAAIAIGVFIFVPKNSSPLTPSSPSSPELVAVADNIDSVDEAEVNVAGVDVARVSKARVGAAAKVVSITPASAPIIPGPDSSLIPGSDRESQPEMPEQAGHDEPATKAPAETEPIHVVPAEKADLFAMAESPKSRKTPSWIITAGGNIQNNKADGAASGAMRSAGDADSNSRINDLGDQTFGIPLTFGVGVIKTLPSGLGFGTGVNYSLLPRTFRGTYTPEDGAGYEADITERQHFIGIPLNVFYEIVSTEHFSFHVFAGGEGEKLISRNFTITGDNTSPVNYSEGAKGIQWSVGGGIGMEFKLTRHLGLYLDPGVRYYFNCAQPRSIRTIQPFMFNLEAGLRLDL